MRVNSTPDIFSLSADSDDEKEEGELVLLDETSWEEFHEQYTKTIERKLSGGSSLICKLTVFDDCSLKYVLTVPEPSRSRTSTAHANLLMTVTAKAPDTVSIEANPFKLRSSHDILQERSTKTVFS